MSIMNRQSLFIIINYYDEKVNVLFNSVFIFQILSK